MKKTLLMMSLFVHVICNSQLKTVYSVTPTKNISCFNPAFINNNFYFAGTDPSISGLGVELILSDSTQPGTNLIKDINTLSFNGSNPEAFTKLNNAQVVCWAQDATNGKELWITDGTNAGTNLIKDITPGSSNNPYGQFISMNNEVYFMANDGTNGLELWKTDGTSGGTNMIKNINPIGDGMAIPSNPYISSIATMSNNVYFIANNGTSGLELWKTDGTNAGTVLVKDIYTGSTSSTPNNFLTIGNTLYFTATTAAEGNELWKSDGTSSGTVLVKDLSPLTAANTNPSYLKQLNNKVYFLGFLNSKATLFESDGTAAGTFSVFTPTNFNTNFSRLTKVDSSLYFFESNTTSSPIYSLYKYNPTTNTTSLIKSGMFLGASGAGYQPTKERTVALNGMLYFTFDDGANGDELWQSDGTTSGTKMITDIGPGSQTSWIDFLIPINNGNNSRLYFTSTKKTGLLYIKADAVATGLNDVLSDEPSFTAFPNPSNGEIKVNFSSNINENTTLSVFNSLGQMVQQKTNLTDNATVELWDSGVYFLKIENKKGLIKTQKIIITK